MMEVIERLDGPYAEIFKTCTIGLVIGAVGTAILTAPVSLPALLVSASGYLVTAGSVIVAVSQLTITADDATATIFG